MSTIQIRTDGNTKKQVQEILEKLGLDMSTAINMYLMQIIIHEGIPFQILTENGFTPEVEEEILQEIEDAKKNGKVYSSVEEMHKDILSE